MSTVAAQSSTMCVNAGIDPQRLPGHVAIIMDGNGRWAQQAGWQRLRGHEQGAETVRSVTTTAATLGIRRLSLYAFSSENWARPKLEVDGLMRLLVRFLRTELPTLQKNNVRLSAIGRLESLPKAVQDQLQQTMEQTAHHDGLELCLALAYGGRQEIVDAVKKLTQRLLADGISADQLSSAMTEEGLQASMYAPDAGDVDLLIRTAGEQRISNFLPWQTVYAEYYAAQPYWPDFGEDDFLAAIRDYQNRERRFGKTSAQIQALG